MAMIACRECKAEVSASAEVCPSCGAKAPGGARGRQIAGLIYMGLVVWAFVWIWGLLTPDEKTAPDSAVDVVAEVNTAVASPTPTKWHTGGTLHKASALDWQKADPADKLATSADWLAALWNGGKLKPEVSAKLSSVEDLQPLAEELVKQLDVATEPDADAEQNRKMFTNQKMDSMAVMTLVLMGWVGA